MRTRTVNGQTTVDTMSYNAANQLTAWNGQAWEHDDGRECGGASGERRDLGVGL
ncbi:MAG: hypothetical protein KatS3mg017_0132 [Fimbriimonadales bacterium]|nr:MAG: hypothetical protein KatS3mg017_0132 [Fimbriimonadales bacterium]